MQKLVNFTELSTLQIDQIFYLFNSLRDNTLHEPENLKQKFICPHTVICNLEKMEFEKKNCTICPTERSQKKYLLSGILYFLLGGIRDGNGEVEEFYTYGRNYFDVYGILSEELFFRSLCFLMNENEYQRKLSLYNKIKSLNVAIQPQINSFELKRFCLVVVNPGLGILYQQYDMDMDEITVVNTFKIFLESYQKILYELKMNIKDFKICIHSLFLGELQKTYYNLKFNLFYDYICNCHSNRFSQIFYNFLSKQCYQAQQSYFQDINSFPQSVKQIIQKFDDENDMIELLKLLNDYIKNKKSLKSSFLIQQQISFYSRKIMQELKQLKTDDELWNGYKILLQQEIIELIECQNNKNNNVSPLKQKQLFGSYKYQVQQIQAFSEYKSIKLFETIKSQYSQLIQEYMQFQFIDFDDMNISPLLKKRTEIFQTIIQFRIFKDYLEDCKKKQLQPIIETINLENIIQYEEQLKESEEEQQLNQIQKQNE
ncbi:unnamed protein product [Paramecium sonneborni]|uniref:Uncharacterized protein n=1 Tax=Paramecium sonneborni TaxID=65129 RepID=A0A8S1NLD3_9CILI|nr:unnamed protein product [Paramecium sonneborni]